MTSPLIRDTFEMMIVVGVGGTLVSAVRKLRRHEIEANICNSCGRPCSRAYPACTKCGAPQSA